MLETNKMRSDTIRLLFSIVIIRLLITSSAQDSCSITTSPKNAQDTRVPCPAHESVNEEYIPTQREWTADHGSIATTRRLHSLFLFHKKIRKSIVRGEFMEFPKLLAEHMAMTGLLGKSKSGHKPEPRGITSLDTWLEAWCVFASVLTAA